MLTWTSNDLEMQIEMLELFSGRGRVTEACREAGRSCIAYDSLYDPSGAAMNFLSDGGFALEAQYRVPPLQCMHASIAIVVNCHHAMYIASKASHDLCFARGAQCPQHVGPDLLQLVHYEPRDFTPFGDQSHREGCFGLCPGR